MTDLIDNQLIHTLFGTSTTNSLEIETSNVTFNLQTLNDETIMFEDLFDLSEIQRIQDEFADVNEVASVITRIDGTPITKPSNFTYLCSEIIRKTEKGCFNCYKSDAAIGRYHPENPIIQTCMSGGLWDAGASITVGGQHVANWLIGQVRNEAQSEEMMKIYANEIGADEKKFLAAFYNVPTMSLLKFEKIACMLFTIANQLSKSAYQTFLLTKHIEVRKQLESALFVEKNLLETTLMSVGDGVISIDRTGHIYLMNPLAEQLTGFTLQSTSSRQINEVFNSINIKTNEITSDYIKYVLSSQTIKVFDSDIVLISANGTQRTIEGSIAPIIQKKGDVIGVVIVFRDISEKKNRQEEIVYLSYHDYLTGLYNRRFYEEELHRLYVHRNLPLTIIMGDVNGLKLINDSFGHSIGDQMLKKVAEVLTNASRSDDIIARLGGDEFVLILIKTDSFETERIIKRISTLASFEKVNGIDISISFGYETITQDNQNIKDILKSAEDHMYRHKLYESSSMRNKTIDLIINTLYEKSPREMLHSKRVSSFCEAIAKHMGFDKDKINQIKTAGLMHDIGKIGIDENVLNSINKLNAEEWNEMKRHPEVGYRILSSVNELSEIAIYVLEHQEMWNGNGYPKRLSGNEITLEARIIAVADSFDAMTSDRTYRKALSKQEAIDEILRCSGTQFDPDIVTVFTRILNNVEQLKLENL